MLEQGSEKNAPRAQGLAQGDAPAVPDAMHGKQWAYFIPATVLTIAALAAVTVALILGIETRLLFIGQGTSMLAAIVTIPMTLIFGVCGAVVALIALPLCRPLLRYAPRQGIRRTALVWFLLDIVAVVCAAVAIVLVFFPVA